MNTLADAFSRVKPLFETVLHTPNVVEFRRLKEMLGKIDGRRMQLKQNILKEHLVTLLDKLSDRKRNEIKTSLLECLCSIVVKCKLHPVVAMTIMLIVLLKIVYDISGGKLVDGLPKDINLASLKTLAVTSNIIETALAEQINVRENLSPILNVLQVCVNLLATELLDNRWFVVSRVFYQFVSRCRERLGWTENPLLMISKL
ncbi:uncharacterized protein LOC129717454 [Wyeomyia smithii]|uniref:uncharacterized protein LOC129717454 n=1 Tax=Wyeomyia smithii TaxID=174621 RepID=UPI002467B9BF|nr:uncharacterized protein LOC129717454 [Wyeomyia smithii]